MAVWQGMMLTNAGIELHADVEAGKTKLNLVKVKTGSFDHSKTLDQMINLTDLKEPKQVVDLLSKEVQGNDTYIHCAISNHDLQESYLVRELGLFAETDSGTILYGVMIASEPDLLSAHSDSRADETIEYDIMTSISSTDRITIKQPDGDTWVNFKFLNSTMQEHNTSEQAHANLFGKVNQAINDHRTNAELDHPAGSVKEKHLAEASVGRLQLKDNSVYGTAIKNGAITSDKIADGAIYGAKMCSQCVNTAQLAPGAVTLDRMAKNSVGHDQLVSGSVFGSAILYEGITKDHLSRDCINTKNLNAGCVIGSVIADNVIQARHIQAKQITPEKLSQEYLAVVSDTNPDIKNVKSILALKRYLDLGGNCIYNSGTPDGRNEYQVPNLKFMRNNFLGLAGGTVTGVTTFNASVNFRDGCYVKTSNINSNTSATNKEWVEALITSKLGSLNIKSAVDVINALDSQTLASLGVKYSLQENGYICFGKLFGGLILQWGNITRPASTDPYWQKFVISFPNICVGVIVNAQIEGYAENNYAVMKSNKNQFYLDYERYEAPPFKYIAFGI